MKRFLFLFTFIFSLVFIASSQEVLLTINDKEVTKSEFERIYLKNNTQNPTTNDDIDEYLELFINFKIKVFEAEKLGYDTTKSFLEEFNHYYTQLAEPYFKNQRLEKQLLKEAYERSKKEVRLSYMLFRPPSKEDTVEDYNQAMEAYKRVMDGEDFQEVAFEVSEAKSIKKDKADAWYNKVFMMPYELENFAFTHKIGDVSKPILANKTYFILKITDFRKVPQRVKASHIYVGLPYKCTEKDSLKAMEKIKKIEEAFENGESFAKVAKRFSEDKYSATKGGDLGWFSTGKMIRNFETAVYSIENIGDSIGPIRSAVGYHFIKLTGRDELKSFEDEKKDLLKVLKQKKRYQIVKQSVIDSLKKVYDYKLKGNLNVFYDKVDSTIFLAEWKNTAFENDNTILFKFDDKEFTNKDFAEYLQKTQKLHKEGQIKHYIDTKFDEYVEKTIKKHELSKLPEKNDEFKYLMQEYHDGLLLFDITNDKVWNKAVKDTIGLKNYYKENRNEYTQKLNLAIYSYSSKKGMKKIIRVLKKKEEENYSDSLVVEIVNKRKDYISLQDTGLFKKGDNPEVDYLISKMKNNEIENDRRIVIDKKNKKIIYLKNNLPYVKGLVTADYQEELEKEWIKELRSRYKVEVNKDVLEKIKSEN